MASQLFNVAASVFTASVLFMVGGYVLLSPVGQEHHAVLNLWPHSVTERLATGIEDNLEAALRETAVTENKTLIVSILNAAYAEPEGLLDLFLRSMREGEGTNQLLKHTLLVATDRIAYDRCINKGITKCYHLHTAAAMNLSLEQFFMSRGFIEMMWQRIRLLRNILKHGYSFIFTDLDVMWLRNPFDKLENPEEADFLISCDRFNSNRSGDLSDELNTGFFFASANGRTVALFDEWYARRGGSEGKKEQDVLNDMKSEGAFRRLGVAVRVLDTRRFNGFCDDGRVDFAEMATVHANCCRSMRAKVTDLTAVVELRVAERFNRTVLQWPAHTECVNSWRP